MILHGDCIDKLKELEPNSVDAIVTDPPYGLSFMGKKWDYDVPSKEVWSECLRVLKPGGYLLSFAGTRTQHRMAVNIEDAGFEIRDMIAWVYGSGFPKSLNIGKVMDKFLKTGNASWNGTGDSSNGALGYSKLQNDQGYRPADYSNKHQNKAEITEEKAKEWEGWGTALKPALEPITVARKPLAEKTVAENVLKYGTGGINIDGSRIEGEMGADRALGKPRIDTDKYGTANPTLNPQSPLGRFPANLIHDGSDEVVSLFPDTGGGKYKKSGFRVGGDSEHSVGISGEKNAPDNYGDSGSAARFFMACKDTQKQAIMSVCNDINVNNVGSNLMISQLTEKIVKIHSVLQSATPNLDLLNQSLNALFVETNVENTEIDFVARLVAIKEVPEDLVSQEELQVFQDFITNFKDSTQPQKDVNAEKWASIDTTQITLNCLKLCGYVLLVIDENTKQESPKSDNDPKRFAYIPKASKADRDEGLSGEAKQYSHDGRETPIENAYQRNNSVAKNNHPTVKPTKLMQYLVKLVTPKGGVVLDPFMGSGSTGKACKLEGFDFIGIEREAEYIEIAKARINVISQPTLDII
jgi:DNA modification methylase